MNPLPVVIEWFGNLTDGDLTAFATGVMAFFTIILTVIAARQWRDSRILHRAYVGVKPDGVHLWSTGHLILGHVVVHNAGNLPANHVRWTLYIDADHSRERTSFPINEADIQGDHFIMPKGEMGLGSPGRELQSTNDMRDKKASDGSYVGCHVYVWGIVRYDDGFKSGRTTRFCHRYDYQLSRGRALTKGVVFANEGRDHRYGNSAD